MNKTCSRCRTPFAVAEWDLALLRRLSPTFAGEGFEIPPPDQCPRCRLQRRLVWRSELKLSQRKCDFSGRPMLSRFRPDSPYTVYDTEAWWKGDWDALEQGRDFDFSRPFFEQFDELIKSVPLLSLSVLSNNENCDYVNAAGYNRNCYLIAGANGNEDCYYANYINGCRDCVDCNFIRNCELCYELVDCERCYRVYFSENSSACSESYFLKNCRSCRDCFGSVNLVNRQYVWFNEQLTAEEYAHRLAQVDLQDKAKMADLRARFEAHARHYPNLYMRGEMNENVTGGTVRSSRNCFECFDVQDSEDCKYTAWFKSGKDVMDVYSWGFPASLAYQCVELGDGSQNVRFSASIFNSSNILYSYYCVENSQDCFGSVGLKRQRYAIFNKVYSKEDYENLAARIVKHMQKTGEWGQFFPMELSPFDYDATLAQDHFPRPLPEEPQRAIPADALRCAATGKPYRLVPQELAFYKKMGLPVPEFCFAERHRRRVARRLPLQLWDRQCMKCGVALRTAYAPDRPEIVYCEGCYLGAMY